ncbi:MAG: DUF547 domain-containing protein [Puniceicoccaceae bacterium]|nr:MAG: DUF547 domain-containing protein [Puniceicoccaceae bacterium]
MSNEPASLFCRLFSAHRPRLGSFGRLVLAGLFAASTVGALPDVPAGIEHDPLDALLRKYVDERGFVDYAGWQASVADAAALKAYLEQFAPEPESPAEGDDKIASLINAYNAFTIAFVLDHYPTESIRLLNDPFAGKHHRVGGEKISVDDIEHEMLRPEIGWKVHAVVVCAARSCPPLLNRAYRVETWEEQMEERYRTWLAREDLNAFDTGRFRATAEVSRIFRWYAEDFTGDHALPNILRRFGPESHRDFLSGDFRITFKSYHWGLNDQSELGSDYRHSILRSLF